ADRGRGHRGVGKLGRGVAAAGKVFVEALGIQVAAVPEDVTGLTLVERNVVRAAAALLRSGMAVEEAVDGFAVQQGSVGDLRNVGGADAGVEDVLGENGNQRPHLAEPLAPAL